MRRKPKYKANPLLTALDRTGYTHGGLNENGLCLPPRRRCATDQHKEERVGERDEYAETNLPVESCWRHWLASKYRRNPRRWTTDARARARGRQWWGGTWWQTSERSSSSMQVKKHKYTQRKDVGDFYFDTAGVFFIEEKSSLPSHNREGGQRERRAHGIGGGVRVDDAQACGESCRF